MSLTRTLLNVLHVLLVCAMGCWIAAFILFAASLPAHIIGELLIFWVLWLVMRGLRAVVAAIDGAM